MNLLVDSRELKIIEQLKNTPSVNYTPQFLELGDFILRDEQNQEIIFERKTWDDLKCSLKDQRYREQRSRLLLYSNTNNHVKISYIIEGKYDPMEYEVEKKTVLRLLFAYQIPVFFCQTMQDTIDLFSFFFKLENLNSYFISRNIEIDQVEARISKRLKKNYDNPSLFFQETLCFLKGMSTNISYEISRKWNSIHEFISDYQNDLHNWETKLKNIEYKTKQNNVKKINKNLIDKIRINFFSS